MKCICSGARNTSHSPRGYGSAQQLAGQVSDLKIELARRDAEVEYLEGQLAEAVAANRPHVRAPADQSSSQVLICCAAWWCDVTTAHESCHLTQVCLFSSLLCQEGCLFALQCKQYPVSCSNLLEMEADFDTIMTTTTEKPIASLLLVY